ncbi:MAG: hypothetical protein KKD44_07490 [Proteobacteria bacterium]|nr:hypothetical protein [Pseudomonadota bacterium]
MISNSSLNVITSIGTIKPSYLVPLSMQASVQAIKEKWPNILGTARGQWPRFDHKSQ